MQTHCLTHQISTETGLTQTSIIQIIHHSACLKYVFHLPNQKACVFPVAVLVFLNFLFYKVVCRRS